MQNEPTSSVGYTIALFGGTFAFTMADMIQILGLVGMFIGLAISFWGHYVNKQRTAEMRRANDLKERELNDAKK